MKQGRILKRQLLCPALAVPLLLLCAWPRASVAQAAIADSVVAWGDNDYGQATVPVAAQNGLTAIAAGMSHTVALKNDGSVVAWGNREYGLTTIPPAAQSGVVAIAAGSLHTVALKDDGSVVAWGYNGQGQVTGIPATWAIEPATANPVTLGGQVLSGVTAIAAGSGHTVALKNDGSVVAWGRNDYGQRTIPLAARSGVTAITAGSLHTVALKSDGSVVAWGYSASGLSTIPLAAQSGVRAIAAGDSHTVALKNDGTVVAWGNNFAGQTDVPAGLSGVRAIAAGTDHTLALKEDGSVVAWGADKSDAGPWPQYGQTIVPIVAQSGVSAIAAGAWHSVALVTPTPPNIATPPVGLAVNVWQGASFTVVATGYPLNYQWRKDGVDVAGATNATYGLPFAQTNQAGSYTIVVSNSARSVTSAPPAVLTVNPVAAPGTVVAWGWNGSRQPRVPVAAQSGVVAIAIAAVAEGYGDANTVALKEDGSVVAWGSNGQTDVPIAARSGVTAIAAGWLHTVALKNDGSVVAWGNNGSGQVTGTQATNDSQFYATASPVMLGGQVLSGVTAIAAGWLHTVALKNDGSVVAWGAGTSHMVNFPNVGQSLVPVAAQNGVAAIAAGFLHTVALKNDGTVVMWGDNRSGQVTGTPTIEEPPFQIASPVALGGQILSGVTAIAAGGTHTIALQNDGTMVAWGYNREGQVTGTPTTDDPYSAIASPVTLGGRVLRGVTAIAASSWVIAAELGDPGSHTVALKNDGTVVAWGNNRSGQVTGTPTTDDPYSAIARPVTLEGQVLSGVTAIAAGHFQTVALIGGVLLLPSLKARPNGNELILSWPTNAPGFTLQSTLNVIPPVTWLYSTSVPTVIGAQFTLTNSTTSGAQFYRLRKM